MSREQPDFLNLPGIVTDFLGFRSVVSSLYQMNCRSCSDVASAGLINCSLRVDRAGRRRGKRPGVCVRSVGGTTKHHLQLRSPLEPVKREFGSVDSKSGPEKRKDGSLILCVR